MIKFSANRKEEDWDDLHFGKYLKRSMDVLERIRQCKRKKEIEEELERLEFGENKYLKLRF
jgi:hypothetical protein